MSVISGGIFSKPRGKTGGIVFGAARTRNGKLATARELVKPSNPNTAGQQEQRNKFKSVLALVRRFGASIYQTAWNRSIGQLPGFQSMMSILLGQIASNFDITLVNEINLGTLHYSGGMDISSPNAGEITIEWDGTDIGNGTATDIATALIFAKTDANRELVNGVEVHNGATRNADNYELTGFISGETYMIYVYFVGSGNAEGLYSVAKPYSVLVS